MTGKKRGRASSDDSDSNVLALELLDPGLGPTRKKARTGFHSRQWITVYGPRRPIKQRCGLLRRSRVDACHSIMPISMALCCNTILQKRDTSAQHLISPGSLDSSSLMRVCRYHYNVSADRLMSHVRKGWDQNLRISSATSNANLWAVVMDQSTGYTKQTYKVGPSFLPKSWCLEQWDAGFYITAVAGAEEYTLRWRLCPCLSGSCCAMKLGTV